MPNEGRFRRARGFICLVSLGAGFAIVAGLVLVPGTGWAADITWGAKGKGPPVITLDGEIRPDDDKRFGVVADEVHAYLREHADIDQRVIVGLGSPGGTLLTGLAIGEIIRGRHWATMAEANVWCFSTCAAIWVAGMPRFAVKDSYIGFHAAYDGRTGQEWGTANAFLGSYLTRLGFGLDAIAYMTAARPSEMKYLSAEAAQRVGIAFAGTLPSEADLATPPVFATTATELHLREQPDPQARDVLPEPAPRNVMPKDAVVRAGEQCAVWTGSGRGAQDADNIWCFVHYLDHRGWANAYYLMAGDQRVACIKYPNARLCPTPSRGTDGQPGLKRCGPGPRWLLISCITGSYGPLYCLEYRRQLEVMEGCRFH